MMIGKISDNPQYKQLAEQIQGMECLCTCLPFLFTKEQKKKIKQMKAELEEMRKLPEQFNDLFLERGWVCYDNMNLDMIKRCVALGLSGDIENAELELIKYYQGDIRYLVFPLKHITGFKERYGLLKKALDDYGEGRYHACVPVFLMIIDGAINQVLKRNQGLFAEGVDLTLYNSIVGHESGLASLIKIMSSTRKKTNVEEIMIPYRNGILHGMDIGYDNVYVATKALTTLFAVADWIRHYSDEGHSKPLEVHNPSFKEVYQSIVESSNKSIKIKKEKKLLEEWCPRDFVNVDFASYVPKLGTPEYVLCSFFDYYSKTNFGKMASLLTGLKQVSFGKMAGDVRAWLKDIKCNSFKIISIKDVAAAVSEINVAISVRVNGTEKQINVKARLLYLMDNVSCKPLVRGVFGGKWFILDSLLSEIFNKSMQ